MQLGGCIEFTSFYLESYIWPDAISGFIRQRNSITFCASLGKSAKQKLAMIKQAFGEESVSRTREVQAHRGRKDGADEEQSLEHDHHFLSNKTDCQQRIRPDRPNSQFSILLRRSMATA
jgi:hypothetical protein